MTTLVTGAGGFIGSHVVERVLATGEGVRAFLHYNGRNDTACLADIGPAMGELELFWGDIRDPRRVADAVQGCDTVLHLAALISIPYSYQAPRSFFETNALGTMNVLEACRQSGVSRVVVTSTSEVYGDAQSLPMTENHPLVAQSPYAASKIAADKLAESYYRSFGVPVVTLRPFNTFGPRQSPRAIIPTILHQLLSGQVRLRLGSLTPERDLTFVDDTARAFLLASHVDGIEGQTIHIGAGQSIAVGDLARLCMELSGTEAVITEEPERLRPPASEVGVLLCDAGYAARALGWRQEVTLEEGIRATIDWIRKQPPTRDAARYAL